MKRQITKEYLLKLGDKTSLDQIEHLELKDCDVFQNAYPYIAKAYCPSLVSVDCVEDITSCYKLYRDSLMPQIEAVWEARYMEVYNKGIGSGELDPLHQEMISTINRAAIVGSHLTMPDLKKIMIEELTMELLQSVNKGTYGKQGSSTRRSPLKSPKYSTRCSTGTTPQKEYTSGIPVCKENKLNETLNVKGVKRKRDGSPDETSSKRKRDGAAPKIAPVKRPIREAKNKTAYRYTVLNELKSHTTRLPPLDDYDPALFLRCHSGDNDPSNQYVKVWQCAFEPSPYHPEQTTTTLATCGDRIVCFIDCRTGKVMRRYKDNSETESFYALAWTSLQADKKNLKENTNILAVAGGDKQIKLISPTQLVMFGAMEGHRSYISCLQFHPKHPNILFSGSKDKRILVWDIGTPDFRSYRINYRKIAELKLGNTDPLQLVVSVTSNLLLAGCEESCYGWDIKSLKSTKKVQIWDKPHYEFVHPVEEDSDDPDGQVDGLVLLPNGHIVSKCVEHRHLYLWDLSHHMKDRSSSSSRTIKVQVEPLALLQYTHQEVQYVYPTVEKGVLCVGDSSGHLYMYNLTGLVSRKMTSNQVLTPSRVLEWPDRDIDPRFSNSMSDIKKEVIVGDWEERQVDGQKFFYNRKSTAIRKCVPDNNREITVVVNCVAMSSDGNYLAYGTDNNLVCFWRRENS